MTYHEVLDKILDTENTTVGGGSSAALSGAMGAGLIGMVALLSLGKDYGLSDDDYRAIEKKCVDLRQKLLRGCVADTEAYSQIVAAYKLPKETDQQKQARKDAIQAAGIAAASTPRDNGYNCKEVYTIGRSFLDKSNSSAASDIGYGIALAKLGIQGCIANIEANLPMIKDEAVVAAFREDIQQLRKID